ncbi:MAG: LamG domain-containing protein [Phycisphaeraceae bacterium]|nr:LamG domain-containing protein [Phycisphaeraceae bacterium]
MPDMGMFKTLSDDNRRYLEPDDSTPRKLTFVPGRRGRGLQVTANPTRFRVYSYPCVQYVAREAFAVSEGTIAFWMKPVGWSGMDGHLYFVAVTADNCTIRFYNYPGGTYVWLDAKDHYRIIKAAGWQGWKDGQWVFLAFTYKPGQQCFYVDGKLLGKSTDALIEPVFDKTGMIEISEGDQVVDELMIFNQSLPATDIKALYQSNVPDTEGHK